MTDRRPNGCVRRPARRTPCATPGTSTSCLRGSARSDALTCTQVNRPGNVGGVVPPSTGPMAAKKISTAITATRGRKLG